MEREGRHHYHAVVASHIPGRIRVKIDHTAHRGETMNRVKGLLEARDGVSEVRLNHTIGDVTVRYDDHKLHESGIVKALEDVDIVGILPRGRDNRGHESPAAWLPAHGRRPWMT